MSTTHPPRPGDRGGAGAVGDHETMADIPEIKLIKHNAGGVSEADDPSFPFKLEASFSPPSFMAVTFVMMHGGSEDIVVRGMTQEALERFVDANSLRSHPRLRSLTITGPEANP
jgi:hypothetical protein